ncbi:hypothetical protein, partial [Salegentibacter salarius]
MDGKTTFRTKNSAGIARIFKNIFSSIQKRYSILLVLMMTFSVSNAQLIPVLTPEGGVQIDGNLTAGTISGDWVPYYNPITESYNTNLNNYIFNTDGTAVDPATTRLFRDLYNDRNDNIFQGTKVQDNPANWTRTTSEIQNKSEIHNAFYHIATDITGQDWLFVGSDRLGTTGTGYIDFEFFQKPLYEDPDNPSKFVTEGQDGGRTVNDILLSISYDNGGDNPSVDVYIWQPDGSDGFEYVKIDAGTLDAYGATNETERKVPFGAFGQNEYEPYQFVEAAINMTAIMSKVVTNGPCIGVTVESLIVRTKSSSSLTADAKDYIGPQPVELVFGGANIEYNPLVACNYYDKVMPDFNGVEDGVFSANSSGLEINEDTGEINVQKSTPGDYIITYSFTSYGCPKEVTAPFTVVPVPANKPQIETIIQPACETSTGSLVVTDADPDLIYFIRDEKEENPEIQGNSGVFNNIQPGKYILYSKTSYGCVSDSEKFEIEAFEDDEKPEFVNISDNIKKNNDLTHCYARITIADIEFSDNCPGTIISWTLTNDEDDSVIASGTEQFGTYNFPVGKSILEYTLTDAAGNTKQDKLDVEILDTEKPSIESTSITQQSDPNSCNASVEMPSVIANDNCAIKSLKGTRDDGEDLDAVYPVGTTVVTWEAEDFAGNKSEKVEQEIIIEDKTPPAKPTLSDVTVDCDGTLTTPTTTDNCDGTIQGSTTDQLSFSDGESQIITWTFKDTKGNITTAEQIYKFDDTTDPERISIPQATGQCSVSVSAPSTSDNCSDAPIIGQTNDPLTYTEQGSYQITWIFDDGNGNSIQINQNVLVDDTIAPVKPELGDVSIDCNGALSSPTTTDNCLEIVTGTTDDNLQFVPGGSQVITWTFNDGNGNVTTAEQTYNFEEVSAPSGNSNQSFCSANNPKVEDFNANGINIKWYAESDSTTPLAGNDDLIDGEDYFATQTVENCESKERFLVTASIQQAPNAGINGTLTLCEGTIPSNTELFNALKGSPDQGGTWSDAVNNVYTYTVSAQGTCTPDDTATVTVSYNPKPATVTTTETICSGESFLW